jgi:hypothetical protein
LRAHGSRLTEAHLASEPLLDIGIRVGALVHLAGGLRRRNVVVRPVKELLQSR